MIETSVIDKNSDSLIDSSEIKGISDILNDPQIKKDLVESLESSEELKSITLKAFENTIKEISLKVSSLCIEEQKQVLSSYSILFPDKVIGKIDFKFKDIYFECDNLATKELERFKNVEGFNISEAKALVLYPLVSILSSEDVPDEVKQKLIIDFKNAVNSIKNTDLSLIEGLRTQRNRFSLSLAKEKTDGELLYTLIGQNFTNSISKKAEVITRCFIDETVKMGDTIYHAGTLNKLKNNFGKLDTKYGLDISVIIKSGIETGSSQLLNRLIESLETDPKKRKTLKSNFAVIDANGLTRKDFIIKNRGEEINLLDIYEEYNKILSSFKKGQKTNFSSIKKDILDEGNENIKGKVENVLGLDKIDTDIEIEDEFNNKVDSMEFEDLIILLNQLAGIAPVYGGIQDLSVVYYGVEADGNIPSNFERVFLLMIGALDISIAGSTFAKLGKVGKIAKYKKMLETVVDAFQKPNMLEKLKKSPELIKMFEKLGVDKILSKKITNKSFERVGKLEEKMQKAENSSGISREKVLENSVLSPDKRINIAEELIGKYLNKTQQDAILYIHRDISKGVYQNNYSDIRLMVKELEKVGISKKEGRILMENGILGSISTSVSDFQKISDVKTEFKTFGDFLRALIGESNPKKQLELLKNPIYSNDSLDKSIIGKRLKIENFLDLKDILKILKENNEAILFVIESNSNLYSDKKFFLKLIKFLKDNDDAILSVIENSDYIKLGKKEFDNIKNINGNILESSLDKLVADEKMTDLLAYIVLSSKSIDDLENTHGYNEIIKRASQVSGLSDFIGELKKIDKYVEGVHNLSKIGKQTAVEGLDFMKFINKQGANLSIRLNSGKTLKFMNMSDDLGKMSIIFNDGRDGIKVFDSIPTGNTEKYGDILEDYGVYISKNKNDEISFYLDEDILGDDFISGVESSIEKSSNISTHKSISNIWDLKKSLIAILK